MQTVPRRLSGLMTILLHYINRFASGYDADSDNVDEATYEVANLELATPGFFSKTETLDQQMVLTEVKGIKWTVRGDASGAEAATPISTMIEAMLRPYLVTIAGALVV